MRGSIAALAFLGWGCGGGAADLHSVRASVYDTDFATVWNAVTAEMHERFHDEGIKIEDAQNALIVSKWKAVASTVTMEETGGMSEQGDIVGSSRGSAGAHRQATGISGDMIQIRVKVAPGGPPWRVLVDGEGAHRSAESSLLKPYRRGSDDEPIWVQGKIDSVESEIYERLQKHAVAAPPAAPSRAEGDKPAPAAESPPAVAK